MLSNSNADKKNASDADFKIPGFEAVKDRIQVFSV